jgi:hypothetical protein
VRCVSCGAQILLPCGADKCPECGENGTLRWVDEERQEIDDKGLDCLGYVRELRVDDYLSPTTLEEIAEEIRNCITLTESSFEYTVLMDEPDRNLDIDNIMQIHNVLSFHKPQTQIIAIIHNPALIYKLSKLDCVNFIEMTEGYLNKTCTFVSN